MKCWRIERAPSASRTGYNQYPEPASGNPGGEFCEQGLISIPEPASGNTGGGGVVLWTGFY